MLFKIFPALLLLISCWGCNTAPPLPQADLTQPGWTILQGQAVWRPGPDRQEISGELLIGFRADGSSVVNFSKPPFPILSTATESRAAWEIRFGPQGRRYSGHGSPPERLLWIYLPRALAGDRLPPHFRWSTNTSTWRLSDPPRGSYIEGWLAP